MRGKAHIKDTRPSCFYLICDKNRPTALSRFRARKPARLLRKAYFSADQVCARERGGEVYPAEAHEPAAGLSYNFQLFPSAFCASRGFVLRMRSPRFFDADALTPLRNSRRSRNIFPFFLSSLSFSLSTTLLNHPFALFPYVLRSPWN